MVWPDPESEVRPRRILVLTADAGFGHRRAALAVADAMREQYGDLCRVDVVNPLDDSRVPAWLRESQSDYDRLVRRLPELYRLGYDASDASVPHALVERAVMLLFYEVARDLLREYQPDAIVSTFPLYAAALSAVFAISRTYVPQFMVITDLVGVHRFWFNRSVDGLMVPTTSVHRQALALGFPSERIHLTGIPISPEIVHHEQPAPLARTSLGWLPDLPTVLAVGSRRVENLLPALDVINHFGLPLQLAVVTGGDGQLYDELSAWDWHIPVHLYNFVDNMAPLLHAADLIIAKAGGLITTEALASGLPMLLVGMLPGQETGNAEYAVEQGAAELARTPQEVLRTLHHWTMEGGRLLAERAANARRLGKPRAAFDVAKIVFEAAKHGPVRKERVWGRPRLVKLLIENRIRWQADEGNWRGRGI